MSSHLQPCWTLTHVACLSHNLVGVVPSHAYCVLRLAAESQFQASFTSTKIDLPPEAPPPTKLKPRFSTPALTLTFAHARPFPWWTQLPHRNQVKVRALRQWDIRLSPCLTRVLMVPDNWRRANYCVFAKSVQRSLASIFCSALLWSSCSPNLWLFLKVGYCWV